MKRIPGLRQYGGQKASTSRTRAAGHPFKRDRGHALIHLASTTSGLAFPTMYFASSAALPVLTFFAA